ncbi:ABC transporter permease subunit [Prosthecobacter sp. SYSU 5D2]|uniref:ABC transporter permease subunit n=1 Tax=Prosthecobacter sp. SYSU 5D2 TaxID=3134134 RepID=UPI0031FE5870
MSPSPSDAHSQPTSSATGPSRPVPERFIVSKGTLRWDRFMNSAIVFGGIGIIVAVFGIFAFIALEIAPLFKGAHIEEKSQVLLAAPEGAVVGLDEWSELPFYFDGGAGVVFQPVKGGAAQRLPTGLPEGTEITAKRHDPLKGRVVIGTADGQVGFVGVTYLSEYQAEGPALVKPSVKAEPLLAMKEGVTAPVLDMDYADAGDKKLFAAIQEVDGQRTLTTLSLRQKKSLMGKGKTEVDGRDDLTALMEGARPQRVLVAGTADSLLALTDAGEVMYFFRLSSGWELRQRFKPFDGGQVTGVDYLFGQVSVVCYNEKGQVRIYSLFVPEGGTMRLFGLTKEFQPIDGPITFYRASQRNKSFLVGNKKECALCYATTASVRRHVDLPFEAVSVAMDAKAEHMGFLDTQGKMHLYEISDPHPEAGWRAFFGEVWYEGFAKPKYEWQSTSGTDDFEPKLSLIPLIAGSLKGTFYAMLFAVPIALLAAIYTSQFLAPGMKRIVKPSMEIMASLPSVVLGFLAALWLAPLIENRIPSILLAIVSIPVSASLLGLLWGQMPIARRNRLPKGTEYMLIAPVMLVFAWAGWHLGPALEEAVFVATMPDGSQIADFRLWWPRFTGMSYDQRNCMVVGFMMGFAVIPVIFTIAEDALSNVPPSLTSASEALGASRWQVVRTVVLPIASAGILSAIMIGLGRAVGETMVVVMATGNTPLFDESGNFILGDFGIGNGQFPLASHWNPFNGMRTLSANIAVELPEAAQGSTHYRTLFLGALVLFAMTFVLNTAAEVMRQKLREKFKIV